VVLNLQLSVSKIPVWNGSKFFLACGSEWNREVDDGNPDGKLTTCVERSLDRAALAKLLQCELCDWSLCCSLRSSAASPPRVSYSLFYETDILTSAKCYVCSCYMYSSVL
jgi:hypothetical protein